MNLSKELKKKRDAEDRLRNRSPQVVFTDTGTEQGFVDTSSFATKTELAGKANIDHTHTFLDLNDTPSTYIADKIVKVNSTGNALEFADAPSGASGAFSYGKITDVVDIQYSYGGLS
ncbi:MAG TPA: hypothetical protein DCS12_03415 [Clostridiales bacterium]|nr:hypothetical protein [Clostridiales bacterium]